MPNKVLIPSAALAGLGRFLGDGVEAVLPSTFPSLAAMAAAHPDVSAAIRVWARRRSQPCRS
jgi:hypothetical protein